MSNRNSKFVWLLLTATFALLIAVGVAVIASRPPVPVVTLPATNAYDELIEVSALVANVPENVSESNDIEQLREFVVSHQEQVDRVREQVDKPYAVVVDYDGVMQEATQDIAQLTRAMVLPLAEARLAELEGKSAEAALGYADLLVLSSKLPNEGLAIHVAKGSAYETLALTKLSTLAESLAPGQKRELLEKISLADRTPLDTTKLAERELAVLYNELGAFRTKMMIWSGAATTTTTALHSSLQKKEEDISAMYDQLNQRLGE